MLIRFCVHRSYILKAILEESYLVNLLADADTVKEILTLYNQINESATKKMDVKLQKSS